MTIRIRFTCDDVYYSFSYSVNSPDHGDALNSVSAQLFDYCDEMNLERSSIGAISTYMV